MAEGMDGCMYCFVWSTSALDIVTCREDSFNVQVRILGVHTDVVVAISEHSAYCRHRFYT